MGPAPDHARAALLLTNRLVRLSVKPLAAREFWQLLERVEPGDLVHHDPADIADVAQVSHDEAVRYRTLLDAATALGFEEERLADSGITLLSALDGRFPAGLRERLGAACPPFLLVAGPIEWLAQPGLGVVGSRDADDAALATARSAARAAVEQGWSIVSGLASGVDQAATDGAADAGGRVIGVPADGILRASRSSDIRRRVHAGELCIASPYAPDAAATVRNATGRNKIVFALSRAAFVVAAEEGSGDSWVGAMEALDHRFATVAAWAGPGATAGNHALVRRGAVPITDPAQLFQLEPVSPPEPPSQDSLF